MKKILIQILSMVADFIGDIFVYLFYIKGHGIMRGKKRYEAHRRNNGLCGREGALS